jgi:hypothetical protein
MVQKRNKMVKALASADKELTIMATCEGAAKRLKNSQDHKERSPEDALLPAYTMW